jgi:basic membrane lipoprotein Med (substrate-binding protein (PBP1-ABC) superfamily)
VTFVVVDRYPDDPPSQSNVVGAVFREQESGYLAGIVAGLLTKDYYSAYPSLNSQNVVGTLLGMDDVPAVERFRAGFFGGVKSVNASCKILSATTGSFSNPTKGRTDALGLIGADADIVFAIAGATGNGVYQAASEQGTLAIGVDVDQNSLAPATIITSAIKDVDHATHALIGRFLDHTLQGGTTVVFDHSMGATGVLAPFHSFDSTMPPAVKSAVATASAAISAGTVFVPGRKADLLFGTWNGTWTPPVGAPMSDALEIRADGTYTDVVNFPPAVTNSGTIVIDESASTVTSTTSLSSNESLIPIGYSYTAIYSFSKEFDTLTFTVDTGGGPGDGQGVYTRQ